MAFGRPECSTACSPSCFERPYGVVTGSGLSGSSSSPPASPVTTVEQKTSFGFVPADFAAATMRRVPSTFVARILPWLRCEAISAARWMIASGCASATGPCREDSSPFEMSPSTALVPGGSDPGRRTRATTSCPRSCSSLHVARPTKPLAPVTSTLMDPTLPERGGRFLEPVVAPEELVPRGDGGYAEDAARVGLVRDGAQLVLDVALVERALGLGWIESRPLDRGEHVPQLAEVAPVGERDGERRRGELALAARVDRVDRGAHGVEAAGGPRVRPAQRRHLVVVRAPFDLRHASAAALVVAERPRAAAGELEEAAEENRLPARRLGQHAVDPLGCEVRIRGHQVVVEDRHESFALALLSFAMTQHTAAGARDALARNLRGLRVARRWSLGDLAAATGTGKATLSAIENARANPTVETIAALAGALEVDVSALLEGTPGDKVTLLRSGDAARDSDGAERLARLGARGTIQRMMVGTSVGAG